MRQYKIKLDKIDDGFVVSDLSSSGIKQYAAVSLKAALKRIKDIAEEYEEPKFSITASTTPA